MRLSEDLQKWRAERPDEYTMDRFIKEATRLENLEEKLTADNSDIAKCNCAGFMSVKNVLVQICGTCGGVISR